MKYTNLKESPDFVQKTYKLIETAFEYTEKNSFGVDFYPLMNEENHSHCFICIEDGEVIAHIGVLNRHFNLNGKKVNISMYGGIAVHEDFRGRGIFKKLFNNIQETYKDSVLHLLWSEKLELYEKYNFHPCVDLYEYQKEKYSHLFDISQTKIDELTKEELEKITELYNSANEFRISRNKKHWEELSKITSVDLYLIKKDGRIVNYFIMNKGQDLSGIVHEYGIIDDNYLRVFRSFGNVWTPFNNGASSVNMFATILKVGDTKSFIKFIKSYTNIEISNISKDSIIFNYLECEHQFSQAEFLQGVFGPGRFKELKIPPLFVSGLDSI
jgi:predicted N-acetyltransferase YhbS